MTKPRFKLTQRVWYPTKNRFGKIQKVINIDDPEDIFLQGYRYLVQLEGLWPDWSIADDYLESVTPKFLNDIKGEILNDIKGENSQNPPGSTGLEIKRQPLGSPNN